MGAFNSFEQFVVWMEPESGDVEFKEAVPRICRWKIGPQRVAGRSNEVEEAAGPAAGAPLPFP